jgi:hypothetical protein
MAMTRPERAVTSWMLERVFSYLRTLVGSEGSVPCQDGAGAKCGGPSTALRSGRDDDGLAGAPGSVAGRDDDELAGAPGSVAGRDDDELAGAPGSVAGRDDDESAGAPGSVAGQDDDELAGAPGLR